MRVYRLPFQFLIFFKYICKKITQFCIVDILQNYKLKSKLLKYFFLKNIKTNILIKTGVRWFNGNNIYIDENVFININTYLDDKANISIGKGTWIGQYVKIITATHQLDTMEETAKPVIIGNYCWIGANVTILPGVKIGDFVIVGAGSVVTKDIPPYVICVGNPAKIIKQRIVKTPYKLPGGNYIEQF